MYREKCTYHTAVKTLAYTVFDETCVLDVGRIRLENITASIMWLRCD